MELNKGQYENKLRYFQGSSMTTFNNWALTLFVAVLFLGLPTKSIAQATAESNQKQDAAETKKAPSAEDEKKDQLQKERAQWTTYYFQQIQKYEFHLESNKEDALKVNAESGLRWGNPVRGGNTHGELFIWSRNGRAVLAGSILSYHSGENQRRVAHEFHSFSPEEITGTKDKFRIKLRAPGVEFKLIPGAPSPGKSRVQRMVQLRKLSKSFDATTQLRLLDEETTQPLRPLNQPIYRYQTKEINEDGAIFAYVTGTDPELLVAIETRDTKDGVKWHFAAGRFSDLPITLNYKKEAVWEFNQQRDYVGGYTAQHGIDFQPDMPEIEVETKTSKEKPKKEDE